MNAELKQFITAVMIWIVYPPKHWWSRRYRMWGLSQCRILAPDAQSAEAYAIKEVLKEALKYHQQKSSDVKLFVQDSMAMEVVDMGMPKAEK